MEKLQLRLLSRVWNAMHLIVDYAIIRHTANTGALNKHGVNIFHLLID